MAFDFTGKRVWVTGAGRGIGREVATQFVAAGASVVVTVHRDGVDSTNSSGNG